LGFPPKIKIPLRIDEGNIGKFSSASIGLQFESLYPIIEVSELEVISAIDDLLIFCSASNN
jgi:hypothetical protein